MRAILLLAVHLSLIMAQCEPGFHSDENGTCKDIDECADADEDEGNPCGEDTICHNTEGSFKCSCHKGFQTSQNTLEFLPDSGSTCLDINECQQVPHICGTNAQCFNSSPFYSCICKEGFRHSRGVEVLTGNDTCIDIDECETEDYCGQNASCSNTPGSYRCVCKNGFALRSGKPNFTPNTETCEEICEIDQTICGNGTCHQRRDGHVCACHAGFSNYGNENFSCSELNCEVFQTATNLEAPPDVHSVLRHLESSCLSLSQSEAPAAFDGEEFLERLLSMIDSLMSGDARLNNKQVSILLGVVEGILRMMGPLMGRFRTWTDTTHAEVEMLLNKSSGFPRGPVTLLSKHARLETRWETAAGKDSSYPGFTTISLLSYRTLEYSTNSSFSGMAVAKGQRFQMNSKVVTVTVSNPDTASLQEPVILTFYHLRNADRQNQTVCVYWDPEMDGGSWSTDGCEALRQGANHTVCSCKHLSSFAVLMALYEIEDPYEMQVFTWVGLTLSILCLLACILTFALIRSIQSPRNSIHLHLCLSLFVANLVFLFGISRTENQMGCAVVAGLLHFFYLAAFCWMCLEGVQLFRMVVLVFNTSFHTVRMLAVGYGVPAVIVVVSAITKPGGYGTERHCWLSLEGWFIWSFFGPVCLIITVNIFFFIITVCKLAQKFSSLNPDLDNLHKIKAFTITAVAQLCVLGTMWIFGCFQFRNGPKVMSYLFTVLNSLQGILLFVMHCLLSKPVREEYGRLFSSLSTPQKKKYSEFTSSQSSRAQTTKSVQDTGESHI